MTLKMLHLYVAVLPICFTDAGGGYMKVFEDKIEMIRTDYLQIKYEKD